MADTATVQQSSIGIVGEGVVTSQRTSRARQTFVADWKSELIMAGYGFNVTVGGITGGGADLLITGGGSGTTIDSDQPEMAIGTPTGYYHIPLGFTASCKVDLDADGETGSIILFGDQTQKIAVPIAASSTVETPTPLLDGGGASASSAQSAVTTDITDPVASIVLGHALVGHSEVTAAGNNNPVLRLDFDPSFPTFLKGPCSVYACWGGTAAVTGIASYSWAEVPVARYE